MATTISLYKTVNGVTPIRVGRRIFVSGLYWEVLLNGASYQEEARKIARRERERSGVALDVVYLRRHADVVQAGFAPRAGRARKGTVSLAAVAIDALGPTFVAAFPLPDGRYALTAGSNNTIVPDSDCVCEYEEAKERIEELVRFLTPVDGHGELPVYAPLDLWPGGKAISLEELLPRARRLHRLRQRPAFNARSPAGWIAFGAATTLAAAAWFGWEWYQADLARQEAERRAAEMEKLRRQARVDVPDASLLRPWTHRPTLASFVATCTQEIGAHPITLDGWVLIKSECWDTTVTASYARTEGRTVQGFSDQVHAWRPHAQVQFSSDGDIGTIERRLEFAPGGDEALAPLEMRANAFMTYWQQRVVPFEMRTVPSAFAPNVPVAPQGDKAPARPHWRTMSWSIPATARNPVQLTADLDGTGLRAHQITMTFNAEGKLQWSLKGELYGQ